MKAKAPSEEGRIIVVFVNARFGYIKIKRCLVSNALAMHSWLSPFGPSSRPSWEGRQLMGWMAPSRHRSAIMVVVEDHQ